MLLGALCVSALLVGFVSSHPTIYKRNEDAVLSAVLVPVSSTVIPLPIYRVSTSLKRDGSLDDKKTDESSKLITVKMKKSKKDKTGASVKAITREDWEKSLIA